MNYRFMPAVLTIAGSDCSGGAGIQADIKTIEANGCYALSAITALTAQNTIGVRGISSVEPEFLRLQLDACFDDMEIAAVKLGMLGDGALIEVIAGVLRQRGIGKLVVDPVMVSSSGSRLLKDEAVSALSEMLLPLASLITPNISEAELLSDMTIAGREDMIAAGKKLAELYDAAVLIKGGHSIDDANDVLVERLYEGVYNIPNSLKKNEKVEAYADGDYIVTIFKGEKIDNVNTHGTGCTLSAAIAANLAKGFELKEAIWGAKLYINGALKYGINLGEGSGPLNHIWNNAAREKMFKALSQSLLLYGVTDGTDNSDGLLYKKVEAAVKGGITFIQLREKNVSEERYIEDAAAIKRLADAYRIPFVINDNVMVAKKSGADGVHLGQDDMSVDEARIILGADKIIGATAHSVEEALRAEQLGADYLGVGAMFATTTKDNTTPISIEVLKDICEHVNIPVVAIAGINEDNAQKLSGSGIAGIAVVSAIFGNDDVLHAAKRLREKALRVVRPICNK